ncbi:hypothetical protein RBWH47_04992 [Rhodopirellula baltica WH47]|uniref:Uncharacterized protein n=1 Tax=Rhodopirellula baltica WH47 TaxID=991778 RepID=F2AU28_RHOBT|nr:hypothetical protein RBWH47_04992 [Rhodopirellula baltica WH47]
MVDLDIESGKAPQENARPLVVAWGQAAVQGQEIFGILVGAIYLRIKLQDQLRRCSVGGVFNALQ